MVFAALGARAKAFGFATVYAGPLVRSSFNTHEVAEIDRVRIARRARPAGSMTNQPLDDRAPGWMVENHRHQQVGRHHGRQAHEVDRVDAPMRPEVIQHGQEDQPIAAGKQGEWKADQAIAELLHQDAPKGSAEAGPQQFNCREDHQSLVRGGVLAEEQGQGHAGPEDGHAHDLHDQERDALAMPGLEALAMHRQGSGNAQVDHDHGQGGSDDAQLLVQVCPMRPDQESLGGEQGQPSGKGGGMGVQDEGRWR